MNWIRMTAVAFTASLWFATAGNRLLADEPPLPVPQPASPFADAIESHLDYVTEHSLDSVGPRSTAMWLATIDLLTNGLPDPPLPDKLRWRGGATSAGGSNLYWDQATVVAAYEVAKRSGCACYEDAADAYLRDFLKHCIDKRTGTVCWGTSHAYEVTQDRVIGLDGNGGNDLPFLPAWDRLWKADPLATRRTIESLELGEQASLTSLGVSIESLAWLATKSPQDRLSLKRQVMAAIGRIGALADTKTGLIPTREPGALSHAPVSATDSGQWAGSLCRAAKHLRETSLLEAAENAVAPWLTAGFDTEDGMYFRYLDLESGEGVFWATNQPTASLHADVFDLATRPNPHAPLQMAEAMLDLWEATGKEKYRVAATRWAQQIEESLPARAGKGTWAEDYGRAIHFLQRCGRLLDDPSYLESAKRVAQEAMEVLYVPKMGMFRSHPGEDRCDSVDGPGFLLLALLSLEGELTPGLFHF